MHKRIYKQISVVLLVIMLFTSIFSNSYIIYAKEQTGEQMVTDIIKILDLKNESYFNKVIRCGYWIESNISYDYKGLEEGTENRSLYDTMKERTGVCEGYARVFQEFMNQIGVPCLYLSDSKMNHAYNMVLMNDFQWYLVEPQSGLNLDDAQSERQICEYTIKDRTNEINRLIANRDSSMFSPEMIDEFIVDAREELKVAEESLKKIEGDGDLVFSSDRNDFLNGTKDFENHTIVSGEGYYKFSEKAGTIVHGYPIASTRLRRDPDSNQKNFINNTSLKFTKNKITINAATCKTSVKLPLAIKNYSILDITWKTENCTAREVGTNKEIKLEYHYPPSRDTKGGLNISSSYGAQDRISESFKLIGNTIYGNIAKINVVINYPQLSKTIKDSFSNMKVGKSIKLNFIGGVTKNNFDISVDKNSKGVISYDKNTGTVKANKRGFATLNIKSKTNKNYKLTYFVNVYS